MFLPAGISENKIQSKQTSPMRDREVVGRQRRGGHDESEEKVNCDMFPHVGSLAVMWGRDASSPPSGGFSRQRPECEVSLLQDQQRLAGRAADPWCATE